MRKVILLFSFVALFAACSGNKSVSTVDNTDSVTVVADTVIADTINVDTIE